MHLKDIDRTGATKALDQVLDLASSAGIPSRGFGLYRLLKGGDKTEALIKALAERGVDSRKTPDEQLIVAPTLDRAPELFRRLMEALKALHPNEGHQD